ncbi:hypothetical protein PNIG_a2230 [Pseudoalteromonas nigrifaciens]|uniref:Uncharacterized protein n=1 Tax=Pseudoalteromonas nigrifaciens TaxID=28109 RepID=A0AAC9UGT8_9GAMM|nr:hypothetical protein [Pseudoalteromonas nigrifaciens]ASM54270.1 hypothetical protein PNIG_a2230 [Pseudoalteromonas nigrifaciens]GEN41350.1 hypothetical protein PNI02_08160 [Pseudoalteromonas nigrifaciens]SUC51904.1 Uncharacterised protein [Pseudoalteromonas nigrifaciens]
MDKMSVNITSKPLETYPKKQILKVVADDDSEKETVQKGVAQGVQVDISEEGAEKSLADKNQAAFRKLLGNEDVDQASQSEGDPLDELIAEIQEKLEKLLQETALLRSKDDEESQAKVKVLEGEITGLNIQLIELLKQKLESGKN